MRPACPADTTMPLFDGFQKYDHQTGRVESHPHGPGRYGGEGVFVPRDGASAEDDGWLVTYVYDQTTQAAEMVVVNAQDMTGRAGRPSADSRPRAVRLSRRLGGG